LANNSVAAWDPSASNPVHCMAVSGSVVYVGGRFTSVGGQPRSCIAALDAGTGLATAWDPSATGGYPRGISVDALEVSGTTVYAGGSFTSIGGQTRNGIAALDATSGLAAAWNPSVGVGVEPSDPDGTIYALATRGSTLYAGGWFTRVGSWPPSNLAAIAASPA